MTFIKNITTAAALTFAATSAFADSIELSAPMQAASVHAGDLAMVVYYLEQPDHFQVVATYVSADAPDEPARFNMALTDGDAVSFGMPTYTEVKYSFIRTGDTIKVTADVIDEAVTAELR